MADRIELTETYNGTGHWAIVAKEELTPKEAAFLSESEGTPVPVGVKKMIVRGPVAVIEDPTANKRRYGLGLWEKTIHEVGPIMKQRSLFGELDHPTDGMTLLQRSSHYITAMEIQGKEIYGECVIMPTSRGRELMAIYESGGNPGCSTRGFGSVVELEDGTFRVNEMDFGFQCWDFVADPAYRGAHPKAFIENAKGMFEGLTIQAQKALKESSAPHTTSTPAPTLTDLSVLRNEFSTKVQNEVEKVRSVVEQNVRAELLNDPRVGGALSVLEKVVALVAPYQVTESVLLHQKDAEIAALREENSRLMAANQELEEECDTLAQAAQLATFNFYLEKTIGGDPDKLFIEKMLGDLDQYGSLDNLQVKLATIQQDVARKRQEEQARVEERARQEQMESQRREQERRLIAQEVSERDQQIDRLTEALQKANEANAEFAEANRILEQQVHNERAIAESPKGPQLRQALNAQTPQQMEEALAPRTTNTTMSSLRAKAAHLSRAGRTYTPTDEERGRSRALPVQPGFGAPPSEIEYLAGVRR